MVMKKILYVLALAWLVCGVASCEKEVKDYDGQEGVYFYVQYGAAHGDTTIWASHSSFLTLRKVPSEEAKLQRGWASSIRTTSHKQFYPIAERSF